MKFKWIDDGDRTVLANAEYSKSGGCATLGLSRDRDDEYSSCKDIKRSALHEILHLVLARFNYEMKVFYAPNYIAEIEHEIIRKIENFIGGN